MNLFTVSSFLPSCFYLLYQNLVRKLNDPFMFLFLILFPYLFLASIPPGNCPKCYCLHRLPAYTLPSFFHFTYLIFRLQTVLCWFHTIVCTVQYACIPQTMWNADHPFNYECLQREEILSQSAEPKLCVCKPPPPFYKVVHTDPHPHSKLTISLPRKASTSVIIKSDSTVCTYVFHPSTQYLCCFHSSCFLLPASFLFIQNVPLSFPFHNNVPTPTSPGSTSPSYLPTYLYTCMYERMYVCNNDLSSLLI